MAEYAKAFGRIVQRRRKSAGLTQEMLADRAGIAPSSVSQLERGLKSPTLDTILAVAAALGRPAAELMQELELDLASKNNKL